MTSSSTGAAEGSLVDEADFDGPWADFFATTYNESSSPEERTALADGVISDQEYAYFQSKITTCMGALGLEAEFLPDRTLSYSEPKNVSQVQITECMSENGLALITLRDGMDRNPENLDENEIMVECLREAGVVDNGYSSDDFARGESVPSIIDDPAFDRCNADPLGQMNG